VSKDKKAAAKKDKPIVKVPTSSVGRAVFLGSQALSAFSAARALRNARSKGDKLALVHAGLNAALLVVTLLLASRTMREAKQAAETEAAEPLMLPSGKK
jgi:hypothetical protein